MEFERRLRKVTAYHLALFLLPLLSLLYYGWWSAPTLDQRPDNPFRLSPLALRGELRDRAGRPLATSQDEQRFYPLGAAAGPLVGYHLRGRNQSGLEALLRDELSPPAPPKSLWGALDLDRQRASGQPPLKGPDLQLTLDGELQTKLYELLGEQAGAVVVARLDNGEVLAAVSAPSFDPNQVARDFQTLRADPRSPLIERVGSGLYPVRSAQDDQLLTLQPNEPHPWLQDSPFPDYPGASGAVSIEGQLLVSPLMLLQTAACSGQSRPLVWWPKLLPGQQSPPTSVAVPQLPELAPSHGFQLMQLLGPPFGDSPPFQVVLGRTLDGSLQGASTPLVFVAVLEGADPPRASQLRQALLPLLSAYSTPGGD